MNQKQAIAAAKELPWAKWVSMDRTGYWWAFDAKPELMDGRWDSFDASRSVCLNRCPSTNFLESLAEVSHD